MIFPEQRNSRVLIATGTGALITAVSRELVFDAVKPAGRAGYPAPGFFSGAPVYDLDEIST